MTSAYSSPTRVGFGFNPSYYSSSSSSSSINPLYYTKGVSDKRFLNLAGGTETGAVNFTAGIATTGVSDTYGIATPNLSVNSISIKNAGRTLSVSPNVLFTSPITGTTATVNSLSLNTTSFTNTFNTASAIPVTVFPFSTGTLSTSFPSAKLSITLTNPPQTGLLLGYVQVYYSTYWNTTKVSANSYSCIGSLQYGNGAQGINQVLANTSQNPILVQFTSNQIFITPTFTSYGTLCNLVVPSVSIPYAGYAFLCYSQSYKFKTSFFGPTVANPVIGSLTVKIPLTNTISPTPFSSFSSLVSAAKTAIQLAVTSLYGTTVITSYLIAKGIYIYIFPFFLYGCHKRF